MADRFWVGGTATWDATDGLKWATTSGGAGGATRPTANDRALFDANSAGVCTTDSVAGRAICQELDATGIAGSIVIGNVAASLRIARACTMPNGKVSRGGGNSSVEFNGTTDNSGAGWNVNVGNNDVQLRFNGAGGKWVMQSGVRNNGGSQVAVNVVAGHFVLNGNDISAPGVSSSLLNVAAGATADLAGTGTSSATNATTQISISATATILNGTSFSVTHTATTAGGVNFTYSLGGQEIGALSFTRNGGTSNLIFSSSAILASLTVAGTGTVTTQPAAGTTLTVRNLNGLSLKNGGTLQSGTAASSFDISSANDQSVTGITIKDSHAVGGGYFVDYAGTNVSGNTGWHFPASAIGDTSDARWSVRAALGDTSDARWSVRALLADSNDLRWSVRTAIADTLDLRWSVRTTLAGAVDLRWSIRSLIGDTSALAWAVRSLFAGAVDLRWSIRSLIGSSSDARWSVRTALGSSSDARWSVRSLVTGDNSLEWAVSALLEVELDARWSIRSSIGGALELEWATRNLAGGALELEWAVAALVALDLDARWSVRAPVAGDNSLEWAVKILAGEDLELEWMASASTSADLELEWAVAALAGAEVSLEWAVAALAGAEVSLEWGLAFIAPRPHLPAPSTVTGPAGESSLIATPAGKSSATPAPVGASEVVS